MPYNNFRMACSSFFKRIPTDNILAAIIVGE